MWKSLFRTILISVGWIKRPIFYGHVMAHHPSPEKLPEGVLVVVRDGHHEKWACLRCPGGCGEKVQLSLNPLRSPKWSVSLDRLNRPTISPSIRMTNKCGCHYWLRGGDVEWCSDSGNLNNR